MTLDLALRPYQREAVDAVNEAVENGMQRPAIGLPTGTGKTVAFAHWMLQDDRPALVLAHRDELLDQAADKIARIHPSAWIGKVKAQHNDVNHHIVVASVQTLSRPKRMNQLPKDFGRVVVDEAHHSTAKTYRYVLDELGAYAENGPRVLGVSATFERADKANLGEIWEDVVYHRDILWGIGEGYLCQLRGLRVKVPVNFNRLRVVRGDFVDSETSALLSEGQAPARAVRAYMEHAAGRKTLVFTPTVDLAQEMADAFNDAGVNAWCVHGGTPEEERRDGLAAFSRGEIKVVANVGVLTEGYDEPGIDCIIMASPTRSKVRYIQQVGRGTRIHPGKDDCLVLDLIGVTNRLDLLTIPKLFNLPEDAMDENESLQEAVTRIAKEGPLGVKRLPPEQVQILVEAVDLFKKRQTIDWARLPGDDMQFTVSVGENGMVTMTHEEDAWRIWQIPPRGSDIPDWVLLKEAPDLELAQGLAEDIIRRFDVGVLTDPKAFWKSSPASDKQRQALRKWGLGAQAQDPQLSKGDAGRLLDAVIAQAEFRKRRKRQPVLGQRGEIREGRTFNVTVLPEVKPPAGRSPRT